MSKLGGDQSSLGSGGPEFDNGSTYLNITYYNLEVYALICNGP